MNISKQDFNAYVEGTLSSEHKQSIDIYLKANPAEHRALKGAVEYQIEDDFSILLDALDQKLSPYVGEETKDNINSNKSGRIIQMRKSLVPIVASAAAVVLLIFTFIGSNNSYKSYLDTYPDVVTASVRGDLPVDELTILEKGMAAYNNNEMQEAHDLYETHLLDNPTDTKARFYRAITELHLDNPKASLRELEIISTSGNIMQFEDGVRWYKALCLVALKRYEEALPILNTISQSRHYKRNEASVLLRKIN